MATENAHIDAVARVYAASLFELSEAKGGQQAIEEVAGELEAILELARQDRQFGEFLASRILSEESRAASLKKILQGRVTDLTLNFLLVLNEKGRLPRLADVAAAFDQMLQEKFGRVEVDVYTAAQVDQKQLDRIAERLRQAIGREPVLHNYAEPEMIGGLKLQIGDQLIDASVATLLERMREKLTTQGAAEVRSAVERFLTE